MAVMKVIIGIDIYFNDDKINDGFVKNRLGLLLIKDTINRSSLIVNLFINFWSLQNIILTQ